MRGTTKAKVHGVFQGRLDELREAAKTISTAFCGTGQRTWQLPKSLATRDLLHVPSLHDTAFDRNPLNTEFDEVVKTAGTPGANGDVASLKLQIDYNAMEERAFRLRHASYIRCKTHMHGRLAGHQQSGGVLDRVASQATSFLKAGSAT